MNEAQEVKRFHGAWGIDFGKKRINRKPRPLFKRLTEIIVQPRYPILALYRFARHHEATVIGIVHPEIVDRDGLPPTKEVPTRFVLNEPWSIPKQDLKTLYLGPLTQGPVVLVPAFPERGFFITCWEFCKVLAVLAGAITFILFGTKTVSWVLSLIL